MRPRWAELVGISFAWDDTNAWYLPLRSPEGDRHLDPAATLAALKPILEDPAIEKIGQNLKYDMIVLRSAGIELAGVAFDTMVASYLLEAGGRNHNLDELARTYLGREKGKISELIGTGKNQRRMDEAPVRQVADYAGQDAWLPVALAAHSGRQARRGGPRRPAPLAGVAADRRAGGVGIQRDQSRPRGGSASLADGSASGWRPWSLRSIRLSAGG